MIHHFWPLVIGAAVAAGGTATAAVLYTSGPLSGGDSPAPPLAAATATANTAGTAGPTGTARPTGTPTPAATLPPCIPLTPGQGPPNPCQVLGKQDLPPPPGVRNDYTFTPGPIALTPVVPLPGFVPQTPGPTAPSLPIQPATEVPDPVGEATAMMLRVADEARLFLYYLSIITGDYTPCTKPCNQETRPIAVWKFIDENCARISDAGVNMKRPDLWLSPFVVLNQQLGASCAALRARIRSAGEPQDNASWRSLAASIANQLLPPTLGLPAMSPTELKEAVSKRGTAGKP